MGNRGSINYSSRVDWLVGKASNTYTQFGEDGLIEATLARVGETCRHCFEIGAADGRFFSNTLRLREDGWFAVLIESDTEQFRKLNAEFGDESECIHSLCDDLDNLLEYTDIDTRPDVGVIDIDGQDWYLWADMIKYRPRVMMVEMMHDNPVPERGQAYERNNQAGITALSKLGTAKGYTLVATTHCNAIFVDDECLK